MPLEEGKENPPSHFLTMRRMAWGIVGLTWFLWIGFEDRGLTPVLILSGLISISIGLQVWARWFPSNQGRNFPFFRWITIGMSSGALVGPIAVLLALLKTSLHQHIEADFSAEDLALLLGRVPVWILAGLLFGTAGFILEGDKYYN